ncbi:mechanosensitive ion channel family protein [Brevibacterium yomogidense]|uniref:mechanosensitive ion channel family protein n=1 Tax=Brevibacterium yomogidense TaxID=946573 RepID=UPI00211AB5E0|nr:mechanosensitive ion channel family protein [Brevibacterium yomogidense]
MAILPLLHAVPSLLTSTASSVLAAPQTADASPEPSTSADSTPTPTPSPPSVEDVQRSVEESASSGLEFITGTGLRVAVIILVAIVLTFVSRRLIHRFAQSIAEGHTKRGIISKGDRPQSGAADAAARTRRAQRSTTVGSLLKSIAAIIIWLLAVLMVLTELGFDLAPILASAGIAGIALGFGAQTLVKDYLAGFFIVIEDQYGIGDVIDVGEAIGTVEEVGLRTSKIRALDGTLWHVRNGEILRVGNFSQGFGNALLDLPFPYDADEQTVTTIINDAASALRELEQYDAVMLEAPEIMGVQEISGEAVTIRVTIKTKPGEQFAVGRAFRGEFKQQMAAHDLTVPWSQAVIRTMPNPTAASATRRAADHAAEKSDGESGGSSSEAAAPPKE